MIFEDRMSTLSTFVAIVDLVYLAVTLICTIIAEGQNLL